VNAVHLPDREYRDLFGFFDHEALHEYPDGIIIWHSE